MKPLRYGERAFVNNGFYSGQHGTVVAFVWPFWYLLDFGESRLRWFKSWQIDRTFTVCPADNKATMENVRAAMGIVNRCRKPVAAADKHLPEKLNAPAYTDIVSISRDDILRMPAEELSHRVAVHVCEWSRADNGRWIGGDGEVGNYLWIPSNWDESPIAEAGTEYWHPAQDCEQALRVFRMMIRGVYSTRKRFFDEIQRITSIGSKDSLFVWPDLIAVYAKQFPYITCQAALIVTCKKD